MRKMYTFYSNEGKNLTIWKWAECLVNRGLDYEFTWLELKRSLKVTLPNQPTTKCLTLMQLKKQLLSCTFNKLSWHILYFIIRINIDKIIWKHNFLFSSGFSVFKVNSWISLSFYIIQDVSFSQQKKHYLLIK